jgi:hypothetical protein
VVGGVTKAHVGLGSVDNTADTAKPISTATQTALNLKAPLDNPTFTGTLTAYAVTSQHGILVSNSSLYVSDTRAGRTNPFTASPGQVTIGAQCLFVDIAEFTQSVACDADLTVAGPATFTGSSLVLQNSSASFAVKSGPGTTLFSASSSLVNIGVPLISTKRGTFGSDSNGVSVVANGHCNVFGNLNVGGSVTINDTDLNTLIDQRARVLIRTVMGV